MDECKPSKLREAIPDIQQGIFFSLTKVDEIWRQVDRLTHALHGPQPTAPKKPEEPDNKEKGAVEVLEGTVKELRQALIDIEKELKIKLDRLLGYRDCHTTTTDTDSITTITT